MTERERLIELMGEAKRTDPETGSWTEYLADYLLDNGIIVPPCKVGSKVYEIIEDTIPEHHYYIEEYEVQDISTKAIMYADDWTEFGYPNLYFTKEEAEKALAERGLKQNDKTML